MRMFKRFLCVLLTLAALSATAALSAADGLKITVGKVQRLETGTAFDPDTAPEITSAKAGDAVVLTVEFRNDTAATVDVNGFAARLLYDANKVTPCPVFGRTSKETSYQISPELIRDYGWINAGNDKNGFTAVAATGTEVYSVAPGATLALARMAFTVNADADFTFEPATTSLDVMVDRKTKTLAPDAPPFRLTVSGGYAITAVGKDSVTLRNPAPATLAVSYFGADGRFLSADLKAVPADAGTVPATFKDAAKVRVMLMDGECRPLCVYE